MIPIVGDPVAQVKSPSGLSAALRARGENALVLPAHVGGDDLAAYLAGFRAARNSPALIVTVPHKTAVLKACDTVTERARLAGSVNVIVKTEAGWTGDNTDGAAMLGAIEGAGGAVMGRRVLLAGAGGAGSAIGAECLARGAAELAVHDVDAGRRDGLVARLAAVSRVVVGSGDPSGFDVMINATPLGMRPDDPLAFRLERLVPQQSVACVVTRPEVTPLIAAAREAGCVTVTGVEMFVAGEPLLIDAILGSRR